MTRHWCSAQRLKQHNFCETSNCWAHMNETTWIWNALYTLTRWSAWPAGESTPRDVSQQSDPKTACRQMSYNCYPWSMAGSLSQTEHTVQTNFVSILVSRPHPSAFSRTKTRNNSSNRHRSLAYRACFHRSRLSKVVEQWGKCTRSDYRVCDVATCNPNWRSTACKSLKMRKLGTNVENVQKHHSERATKKSRKQCASIFAQQCAVSEVRTTQRSDRQKEAIKHWRFGQ